MSALHLGRDGNLNPPAECDEAHYNQMEGIASGLWSHKTVSGNSVAVQYLNCKHSIVTIDTGGTAMTKKLIQHGNSAALVIEKPILQLLNIDLDTDLEIITDGKNIIISPLHQQPNEADFLHSLAKVNKRHRKTLEDLAK